MDIFLLKTSFWRRSFWALVLITLWLSLIPGEQVPSALHYWDKAEHAAGFAGLSFLGLMAFPRHARIVLLSLALLGVGIEVAQWLTGWRTGDWHDWVADCAGIAIGFAGWWVAALAIKKRR